MKRIIITGASGVGKTTLVEALAPLLSLKIIPELGREICHQMGYQKIGDIPDQEAFKRAVLDAQVNQEEALQQFISDRSAIDCWVLWQRWNLCAAMTYDSESYYEKAREQSQKYTHILYVQPVFPIAEDGFRWTEPDYIKQVDRLVRMTLYDFDLWKKTLTICEDGLAARISKAMDWMTSS